MLAILTIVMLIVILMEDKAAVETGVTMSNGQRTWKEMKKNGKTYWVLQSDNQVITNNTNQ